LEAEEELNTVPVLRSPTKKIKPNLVSKMGPSAAHKTTIKRQFVEDYDLGEVT
jgi:hypothetical protein